VRILYHLHATKNQCGRAQVATGRQNANRFSGTVIAASLYKKNCFQLYEEISANMNLAEFDEIGLSLREGILENHSLFMPETPAIHLYLPSPERTPAAPQPQWLRFSGLHRWSWL
jgi:hypothetical protein